MLRYCHRIYSSCRHLPSIPPPPECFYDIIIHILQNDDPIIVPSRQPIGIFHTSKSRHATGPPNPIAYYFLVVIEYVRGHDRPTKGGRSGSGGAAYVSLQIARVDFDFPAVPSGDGTRNNDRGVVVACGGMGGGRATVLFTLPSFAM